MAMPKADMNYFLLHELASSVKTHQQTDSICTLIAEGKNKILFLEVF